MHGQRKKQIQNELCDQPELYAMNKKKLIREGGFIGGFIWGIYMGDLYGGFIWGIYMGDLYGGFIWGIYMGDLYGGFIGGFIGAWL